MTGSGRVSEANGFGQIDPEAIASPLIATGYLRVGMSKLLLDVAFIDLGGRGQTCF